ncbi:MAG: heme exporter protein CcmB [Gemmatimonadota bacterium]
MTEYLRAVAAIAGKDLRAELRSRTALVATTTFAGLVLVIFNFARDPGLVSKEALAPSVLWVTVAFASTIALNRSFAVEREQNALDGLLLAPVSRSALFVGKYLANVAFVGFVELVTVPLFVLFFGVELGGHGATIYGIVLLATLGFVAVGTVLSAMTVRTRVADLLLPVLMMPFLVPPILVGAQATTRLLGGRPMAEIIGWVRFLAIYDLVFITLALMLFPALMDE